MDHLVELKGVELARVQPRKAVADVPEQPSELHRQTDATVPTMTLPVDAVAQVERYCETRVPEDMRSDVRIEHSVRGNAITIVERRPPWRDDIGAEWSSTKVAQLRYDGANWALYCSDSSGRWWRYDEAAPARDVAPLLAAIDEDVTGIFWG
jgi:hypothetical protein